MLGSFSKTFWLGCVSAFNPFHANNPVYINECRDVHGTLAIFCLLSPINDFCKKKAPPRMFNKVLHHYSVIVRQSSTHSDAKHWNEPANNTCLSSTMEVLKKKRNMFKVTTEIKDTRNISITSFLCLYC